MESTSDEEPKSMVPGYFTANGVPISQLFNKDTIEEIFKFTPGDGDVIIATYPKTGTTWMQYIVLQILSKGESFPSFSDVMEKLVPFLEMVGVAAVDALTTRPRVYKHHMPYNVMKKNKNAKVIYVYRKPEDTFVSFFHFVKNSGTFEFNEFFEKFLEGKVSFGSYFDHILSYLEHKNDENILMVSYESLSMHREEEILRIAKFLGEEYYIEIANNESVLKKIVEQTSFDYMKKNLVATVPADKNDVKTLPNFFRKGVIGDGKKSLSEDQLQRIKKLAGEKMKGTTVLLEWNEEESCL